MLNLLSNYEKGSYLIVDGWIETKKFDFRLSHEKKLLIENIETLDISYRTVIDWNLYETWGLSVPESLQLSGFQLKVKTEDLYQSDLFLAVYNEEGFEVLKEHLQVT
jgi:hypothetical protein